MLLGYRGRLQKQFIHRRPAGGDSPCVSGNFSTPDLFRPQAVGRDKGWVTGTVGVELDRCGGWSGARESFAEWIRES
ncbi:hypothetical protein J6590_075683 [Homalodisca vitripennis]|nr:hypothetical protein J6590_075683 [Homalodisca vitripennis]